MTKTQATVLQEKWKRLSAPPLCEHLNQDLEASEHGYLTGHYHCTTCGEPVIKKF